MSIAPKPLFETYESFLDQDFSENTSAVACVRDYLASFSDTLNSKRGYLTVRLFLRAYSDNSQTFNSYRTQIERLLLWALIVREKPLHELKRQDVEDYLEFCRNPPRSWVGPVIRGRFMVNDDPKTAVINPLMANPNWRPFSQKTAKHHLNESTHSVAVLADEPYSATSGTINQVYSICGRFFEFLAEDGQISANPFRLIKKKHQHRERPQEDAPPPCLDSIAMGLCVGHCRANGLI
ncbi:hypothetical protein [Pseudomonas amygdali]|uniref:hypothetical protein n=1 Tax=Pseudomonas amygdali TaxID=47877 RepID=UPI000B26921E|nr:hypothetical protein [Pseudomonas amygdali]